MSGLQAGGRDEERAAIRAVGQHTGKDANKLAR
jgi:hypothetical protein